MSCCVKTDSHIVNVSITSNCNSFGHLCQRKFDKGITVQTLKDKLELITGARSALMTIEVFDQNDVKVCDLKVSPSLLLMIFLHLFVLQKENCDFFAVH